MLSPEAVQKLKDFLTPRLDGIGAPPDPEDLAQDISEFLGTLQDPPSSLLYQVLVDAREEQLFALRTRTKGTGDWADGISTQAVHTLEILNRALPTELLSPPLRVPYDPAVYLRWRPRPILLLDVDGVVTLIEPGAPMRPGIDLLCQAFVALGGSVVLWSGPGAEHAEEVATRVGIDKYVTKYLAKPDYPITEEAALLALQDIPVLQVDDDATERVGNWPFLHLPSDPLPEGMGGLEITIEPSDEATPAHEEQNPEHA